MNVGKKFEQDFQKCVPDYVLVNRLKDSAQTYGGTFGLRFTLKNPFDYQLWDSHTRILYALELKTVQGSSISFEKTKEDKGVIHFHQIVGLRKWNRYDGVIGGLIIEFRKDIKTFFIPIEEFDKLVKMTKKKSINVTDIETSGIDYILIPQELKRKRYKYDVTALLDGVKERFDRNGKKED